MLGVTPSTPILGGMSTPDFRWTLVFEDEHVSAARAEVRRLSVEVLAVCPQACQVVVTPRGGVRLWDAQGEALDLEALPFTLVEQVLSVFGPGVYALAVAGTGGANIERAFQKR